MSKSKNTRAILLMPSTMTVICITYSLQQSHKVGVITIFISQMK